MDGRMDRQPKNIMLIIIILHIINEGRNTPPWTDGQPKNIMPWQVGLFLPSVMTSGSPAYNYAHINYFLVIRLSVHSSVMKLIIHILIVIIIMFLGCQSIRPSQNHQTTSTSGNGGQFKGLKSHFCTFLQIYFGYSNETW